jgi:hypothetical protein
MKYQGTWDASANTPALTSPPASTTKGFYYVVSTAGSTSLSGIAEWKVGDWAVSNGASWDKVDSSDQVNSVAGLQGSITAANLLNALGNATSAIGGLTPAADRLPYFTGAASAALATFTTFARTLLAAATASAAQAALGLTIGANVQAWDADLDALAAVTSASSLAWRGTDGIWRGATLGTGLTIGGTTTAPVLNGSAGGGGSTGTPREQTLTSTGNSTSGTPGAAYYSPSGETVSFYVRNALNNSGGSVTVYTRDAGGASFVSLGSFAEGATGTATLVAGGTLFMMANTNANMALHVTRTGAAAFANFSWDVTAAAATTDANSPRVRATQAMTIDLVGFEGSAAPALYTSTAAAPSTYAAASFPATLQAGARWYLKFAGAGAAFVQRTA